MIDYSFLNEVSGNDASYKYEVLSIFLDTIPDGIKKLEELINNTDNWDAIYKQAHFLKSSLSIIKISNIYDMVSEIERIASGAKDKTEVLPLMENISRVFNAAHPLLIDEKDKYSL
jgi:HPt (histidine-containing phosphotransfer) domain-containing protein